MPHHLLTTYRLTLWIVVLGLVLVTVGPMDWRPSTPFPLKVERFYGVALVSMAFVLGYPRRWLWVLLAIGVAVTLLEAFQLLIPFRHASVIDWTVKVVGAVVGACGGRLAESWFASHQRAGKDRLV